MAGPNSSPEHQSQAIRETLKLVGDLSAALTTQLKRVQRLSGELAVPGSRESAASLVEEATRVEQHYEELMRTLGKQLTAGR